MSLWWAVPMLLSGGLYVGGLVVIAWERVPTWRASDPLAFRTGLAHTLRRVNRLQPALLIVCVAATIGVASSTGGAAHPGHAGRWRLPGRPGRLGGRVGPAVALACFVLAVVATVV